MPFRGGNGDVPLQKAWLGAHLDCITLIRFGVGGADKGATECRVIN